MFYVKAQRTHHWSSYQECTSKRGTSTTKKFSSGFSLWPWVDGRRDSDRAEQCKHLTARNQETTITEWHRQRNSHRACHMGCFGGGYYIMVPTGAKKSAAWHPKSQEARTEEHETEGGCPIKSYNFTWFPELNQFSDPNPLAEKVTQSTTWKLIHLLLSLTGILFSQIFTCLLPSLF